MRFAPLLLLLSACGMDPELEAAIAAADAPEDGPELVDEPIGDDVGDDDSVPDLDPLADENDEPDPPNAVMLSGPAVGSRLVVTKYAGFHVHASASAALLSVAPHGGVHDSLHAWSNPAGVLPPGANVTLSSTTASHGFYKVHYGGKTGWVAKSKLLWANPGLSRIALAMQSSTRNAFFKHQVHRSAFNRDGPSHSGNCAPTSLAMAALVFGKEPAGLSVEESIHRVRRQYDPHLHESEGTTRSEIHSAAAAIGLNVHGMNTALSPSAALTRLKDQLAAGRVVVLTGEPGKPNAGPSLYEKAFNRAYASAIDAGASLAHSTYNFNGHHAIAVLGRDGNGKYVVGDPLSEVGWVALTGDEMKDFMTRWGGGTGNAVWR